jgi:tRNA-dihydrouridine synthase B
MDGISDQPFRLLTRRLGSAMTYTEFINAIDVVFTHPHLEQHLAFNNEERPFVYQIFDNDAERLVKAAIKLRQRNPDILDINMGCSARTVSGRGAGAGLLRDTQKIAQIVSTLTHSVDIPITAKIRLGWDQKSRNHIEVAHVLEDNGVKLIVVHGRTRDQSYQQAADWDAIAEVKQAVSIPVVGNGDVVTVEDADRMIEQTRCDAVMIGRAAISNPWIFAQKNRGQVPYELFRSVVEEHLSLMISFYGLPMGLILFRKFLKRYLSPLSIPASLVSSLMVTTDEQEFRMYLEQAFQIAASYTA